MTYTTQHITIHNVCFGFKAGHSPAPCDPGRGNITHIVTVARRGNHPF